MRPDLITSIISLVPNAKVSVVGLDDDAIITWKEEPNNKPTETQIRTELTRLQADYDAKEYTRKRAQEYPPVTDYLDGVVKGNQAQIDAYIAACQAVKTKYPKPE